MYKQNASTLRYLHKTNLPDDPGIIHPHAGPGYAPQWLQPLVSVGLVRRPPQPGEIQRLRRVNH